jgi:hypothetical protein
MVGKGIEWAKMRGIMVVVVNEKSGENALNMPWRRLEGEKGYAKFRMSDNSFGINRA